MDASPINAKAETVASLPTFRDGYKRRRCIVPVDNFLEWKAIKGQKIKQPYAIAMQSGEPFALAAIWENWKRPSTEEPRPHPAFYVERVIRLHYTWGQRPN